MCVCVEKGEGGEREGDGTSFYSTFNICTVHIYYLSTELCDNFGLGYLHA